MGNERIKSDIEAALNRKLGYLKPGRPWPGKNEWVFNSLRPLYREERGQYRLAPLSNPPATRDEADSPLCVFEPIGYTRDSHPARPSCFDVLSQLRHVLKRPAAGIGVFLGISDVGILNFCYKYYDSLTSLINFDKSSNQFSLLAVEDFCI